MQVIEGRHGGIIKAFIDGVPFERSAEDQTHNVAALPFIFEHVAIMPDVHMGYGATVGSVVPTKGAIIPGAVGVDIGCGMAALRTSLTASDLPDSLAQLRTDIERSVPHGGPGPSGGWNGRSGVPSSIRNRFDALRDRFEVLTKKHKWLDRGAHPTTQLGTLGGGNHFIEVCLDEDQRVWVMLHSGSRGIGNLIGRTFTSMARDALQARDLNFHLPDKDLAWFEEGEPLFDDYIDAMTWAQDYAYENRKAMMHAVLNSLRHRLPSFKTDKEAVNCHHNYASKEDHFGERVWLTRKGAVSAKLGELGIIPGSMGAKSFIVRGLGNADSFCSCSHGAGRVMSRGEAKRTFTLKDHREATEGVECKKDASVIDETPQAYKDIDAVMAAQSELVEVVHTLKQVLCVKG